MAAFNFPNSPSTNDTHTENGVTFKWNGTVWKRQNASYTDATNLNVTGISTFGGVSTFTGDATFSGNVAIGKTLTYEDVKNVDSVGVITSRAGINLTGGNITLGDSGGNSDDKLVFGAGGDLKIYHDSNHSYIEDTGTGNLLIKSDSVISIRGTTVAIKSADNSQTLIKGVENAGSELYFSNTKRFETTSAGAKVTGTLELTDSLYWDGDTNTTIDNAGGTADFIRFKTGGSTVMDIDASQNVKIHDDVQLKIGASDDLKLFHSSSSNVSYVTSSTHNVTHEFNVGKAWTLQTTAADKRIYCPGNGTSTAVELYHNGSKKFETTSSGVDVTGIVQCNEFKLLDNEHAKFGTSEDLRIYHNGSNGYIKNSTGQQLYRSATHTFENVAGSTEYLRISSAGYVGINETSPGTHLHVEQDNAHSSTYYLNSDAAILVDNKNGSGKAVIKLEHDAAFVYGSGSSTLIFADRENERLRIDSSGRVLIGGTTQAGDGNLIVYSSDRKHPSIKCAGLSNNQANGYTMLGDNYVSDESQVNLGVSYSSSALVLSRCVKVSDAADNTYLSSQDSYACRPSALVMDSDGALRFHTTETNATTTTDSAVSLTEVFKIDKVGNIYQRISNRYMWFGASNQLQIGVNGSDPYINAASGDLQIRDAGNVCFVVRSDNLQMYMDIKMNNDKGISFISADDTATGETVSSSVLDDYEEGSWTPDLMDANGSNVTWNNGSNCRYVKVGRMVYCYFRVTRAETGSKTGAIRFYNLPYAATNSTFQITGTWWLDKGGVASGDAVGGAMYLVENQRQAYFVYPTSTWQQASSRYLQFSEWPNLRPCYGSFTYEAAA